MHKLNVYCMLYLQSVETALSYDSVTSTYSTLVQLIVHWYSGIFYKMILEQSYKSKECKRVIHKDMYPNNEESDLLNSKEGCPGLNITI